MSEQEKKWHSIYDLLNTRNKPKSLCLTYTKQKKKKKKKKKILRKRGNFVLNYKLKEDF